MIGVAVRRAGMLVVDFDPRRIEHLDPDTGDVTIEECTLDQLKAELEDMIGCALPVSLAVRTPSGGVHVYFRMPADEPIGNKGSLPDHVDVRGLGGYTIVPPSYCIGDGKNAQGDYHWLRGDADAPIADMPASLIAVLRAPTPRRAPARNRRRGVRQGDREPADRLDPVRAADPGFAGQGSHPGHGRRARPDLPACLDAPLACLSASRWCYG